jgi:hypothetical protein
VPPALRATVVIFICVNDYSRLYHRGGAAVIIAVAYSDYVMGVRWFMKCQRSQPLKVFDLREFNGAHAHLPLGLCMERDRTLGGRSWHGGRATSALF